MTKTFRNIKAVCVMLICFYGSITHATATFSNLTILVSSCDKYAPLWDPFFISLFKHWPSLLDSNSTVPIVLIANHKSYHHFRVHTINIPNEKSWSDNMLYALSQVKTKYVLLALDDYWVNEPVNEKRLLAAYNVVQTENLAMIQLSYNNPEFHFGENHPQLGEAIYTNKYAKYKASLQMAIWDKEALQYLLKPGENPWQFELAGTKRSHGYLGKFMNIDKNYPIKYLNAMRQGHIEPDAIDYALKNGITFNRSELPILSTNSFQVTYNKFKIRAQKLWDFINNPDEFIR